MFSNAGAPKPIGLERSQGALRADRMPSNASGVQGYSQGLTEALAGKSFQLPISL